MARPGQPRDGPIGQRRAERISRPSPSFTCSHPRSTAVRHRAGATAKVENNLARCSYRTSGGCVRVDSTGRAGADTSRPVTADKQQTPRFCTADDPTAGVHLNAVGGDCRGQEGAASDICGVRMCESSWSTSRRRAHRGARSSRWTRPFPVIELAALLAETKCRARQRSRASRFRLGRR